MRHVNERAGVAPPPTPPAIPPTPLGMAISRFGNRVPVQVIHACNVISERDFNLLSAKLMREKTARDAQTAREAREDSRAFVEEMARWSAELERKSRAPVGRAAGPVRGGRDVGR